MDFHSISCMNVESCDRLITLHWNFGCWKCSATGHFDSVSLKIFKNWKNSFCRFGIFVCSLSFCPVCGFRWSLAQGLSSDTACLAREKRRGSQWCFSHAISAFGTPAHVRLMWTEPLHNCCLLCRSYFFRWHIISYAWSDGFLLNSGGSQQQSPLLPFICLNEGSHCGHMQISP